MGKAFFSTGNQSTTSLPTHGNINYLLPVATPYNNSAYGFENQGQALIKTPGTYSFAGLRILANTMAVGSTTFQSFKNSSAGNITFSIAPSLTGFFQDITHTDAVVADDLYTFRLAPQFEWFKQIDYASVQCIFEATNASETVSIIMTEDQGAYSFINSADDFYGGILSQSPFSSGYLTAVTLARTCVPYICTVRNAYIRVPTNSSATNITATLQKNDVDTAITMTLTAGATGVFEDEVNTVSFVADDTINWHFDSNTWTSGTLYISQICEEFVSASGKWLLGMGQQNRSFTGGTTTNWNVGGLNYGAGALTLLQASNTAPVNGECNGICVYVSGNSSANSSSIKWLTDEVVGTNVVTITALTTGFFDIGNTDDFVVSDQLNMQVVVGSGGALSLTNVTWVGGVDAGVTTGTIVVTKVTDPPGSEDEFDFTATNLTPTSFSLQDGQSQTYNAVAAGSGYGIAETTAEGWTTTYEVSNDDDPGNITVGAGEIVVVTVTNTLNAVTGSGLYKIVPQKRQDTLWIDPNEETEVDVKIPDPGIGSAFLGST